MYSELLEFDFMPEKEDTSITVEKLAEQGAKGFTVRLPINSYTTRMLLIVYSLPLEELLDTLPSATVPQVPRDHAGLQGSGGRSAGKASY